MNNVVKLKTCSVCGKKFYGMTNCKYCCEACKKKSLRNMERVRRIAEREEILGRKKQLSELAEFNEEARAAGMRYGQYAALLNDAEHKEEYEKHKAELRKNWVKRREGNRMFDKFGEFDSYQEINDLAVNLRKEGDEESILDLAKENGIDVDIAAAFIEGDILYLCDAMAAAIGKIEIEAAELKPVEIMNDWVEYLKVRCMEDEATALAVRKKGKSLKGAIAALLTWSFKHQTPVDKDILKAAGVNTGRCTLGIPGMGRAKKIMSEYYLGK